MPAVIDTPAATVSRATAAGSAAAGAPGRTHAAEPGAAIAADAFVRATRTLAVGALLALIALGLAWELWLAPTGQRTLALKVLPLFLPLAGLLRYRLFTCRWVSLALWPYFIEGIVRATSSGGAAVPLAWTEVGLCLLLFAACVAQVRWRMGEPARRRRAAGRAGASAQ